MEDTQDSHGNYRIGPIIICSKKDFLKQLKKKKILLEKITYCKSGNIRGTLIFAYFAQIQQARIQKPAKIFAVPK